jgi:hypothetical protein
LLKVSCKVALDQDPGARRRQECLAKTRVWTPYDGAEVLCRVAYQKNSTPWSILIRPKLILYRTKAPV